MPIYEPGLEELLARNAGRLHFSTDLGALEHARLLFVAVGTPPTYSGDADLSAVHAVVDAMPASDEHALVMKSTVPCGTGSSIKRIFRDDGKHGLELRLLPGVPEGGLGGPGLPAPRPRGGRGRRRLGGRGGRRASTRRFGAPLVRTDIASAEMIKLAANAFLATKISFINEIANVCEETGADVVEVARGMGLDDRIGPKFLQAGIGYGGSCFPKDVERPEAARGQLGLPLPAAQRRDRGQRAAEAPRGRQAAEHLGDLVGKRVALLGLAFKPNTDDMRGASSLVLAARLQAEGARVRAFDPIAEEEARSSISASPSRALRSMPPKPTP